MLGNCHLLCTVILKYSAIQCVYMQMYTCQHVLFAIAFTMLKWFIGNCSPSTHLLSQILMSMRWVQPRISEPWINSKGALHAVLIGPIGDFLCQMHSQDTCTSHELHLPVVKVMSLKSGSRKITHASSKLLKLWVYSDPLWPRPFNAIYWMEDTEK